MENLIIQFKATTKTCKNQLIDPQTKKKRTCRTLMFISDEKCTACKIKHLRYTPKEYFYSKKSDVWLKI